MSIFFWKRWRKTFSSSQPRTSSGPTAQRRPLRSRRLELEALEDRVLPSADPVATPTYIIYKPSGDQPYQSPGPVGYTPQQIQTAYGINQLYGTIGNGAGQTIAIIDAYDDPAFVDSTASNFDSSDLHQFDVAFGLPDPPSFIKLNQNGGTTLPGVDPAGPPNDWEGEEALDVEWAHAIAPGANIILFEANSGSTSDLFTAVATAAAYPGVSVVSMSFGSPEMSTDPSSNSIFTTPAGHQGVTFLAAAGDTGSYEPGTTTVAVNYPAASPNVLSVGGTNLQLNPDNSYKSETAWGNGTSSGTQGGSGGGISQFEPEPGYQSLVQSTGQRTVPDVAFDADPASGVAVYDSYDNGASTPWAQIGGTSLAAPSWGGLIAIADQGLVAAGGTTLNGPTQTLPLLYNLYQTQPGDFHDITSGSNGAYSAGPGYDEVTGLGSPAANLLIPALIGLQVHNTLTGATEGQPLTNVAVATFFDPTGSQPVTDYTATITWGDGNVSSGTIVADGGSFYTVLGSNTYINPGTYVLTVSVQNITVGLSGTSSSDVTVADAPLNGSGQVINTATGDFATNALVGVFTDTDTTQRPASNYTATVIWDEGDGLSFTSVGTITALGNNVFAVYGSSPFSFPLGGLFGVQVVVRDVLGGASVTINSVVNVANNEAIPPLIPQYSDTGPLNSQYVSMEDALMNLLQSEQLLVVAVDFGTSSEMQAAFSNLVNAFMAYETAVFDYDMQLPGA
jgi:subtilase family serine protease